MPNETTDRFPSIKQQLTELDAAGRLSPNSPLRWLVGEVDRLRALRASIPTDQIGLLVHCTDHQAPSLGPAAKTVQTWLLELPSK